MNSHNENQLELPKGPRQPEVMYIGYQPAAPRWTARFLKPVLGLVLAIAAGTGLILASSQRPIEDGLFEYAKVREFHGVLFSQPLPMLLTASSDSSGETAVYLLVGQGKRGFMHPEELPGRGPVTIHGSLIQKQDMKMIEVASVRPSESAAQNMKPGSVPGEKLGRVALVGEIVDTKCYFGVMRPATGKVHRACAIRCLSGGVPPGLLVRDEDGNGVVAMLVGPDDKPFDMDVQLAGLEVRVEGALERSNGILLLRVGTITRI